jgi:L-ascorbate metabolism protein UlaG (beta-lactamase superfamily)
MTSPSEITVRLVRHATVIVEIAGRRLLVDPMLDPRGARPPVANTRDPRPNPLVDLPEPAEAILAGVDAVLISHLHADHLDETGQALIGGRYPAFCQPEDLGLLREREITRATAVDGTLTWEGIELRRTPGRHGTGAIGRAMAPVSGFVIRARERSVYVAGDTIWCDEVAEVLDREQPDAVVVNAGGARFLEGDPITMTPEDVLSVQRAAPRALVIAVHMEAINHCHVTRADLAAAIGDAPVTIPDDGATVAVSAG